MEILAPAGSEESLIAAVQSGADAVYIGGRKFSARHSAKNFSSEDMKRMIEYCHIRGTAVHVAANILIKEKETTEFIDYIGELNEIGADAVIIQDIGMATKVKKIFPDLPLHASTQMTAASLDAVEYLSKIGFSRVVLSRELSFEEIEHICKNTKAEIEVFAHGALCMCYSGQCLMSSIIGGRSGNRGMCAQPCRLFYSAECGGKKTNGYLLSPKDMSLIDELARLESAGVASLKIEGRLKRSEYVAAVTGIYCKYKNFTGMVSEQDYTTLKNAFNRSGFTKGYFIGKTGREMMSTKTPGNVGDNKFDDAIKKRCRPDANERRIGVDIYASLETDKPIRIDMLDSDFNSVSAESEMKAQRAETKPLTAERLTEQLSKLGTTPFYAKNIEVTIDDGITLPISEINNTRRKAAALLESARAAVDKRCVTSVKEKTCRKREKGNMKFSAQIYSAEQAEAVLKYDVSIIYAPSELAKKIKELAPEKTVVTVLPPIWRERDRHGYYIADGVLVSNIGQLEYFKDCDIYGGARLNIYNNESIKFYDNLKTLAISPELNIHEISELSSYLPLEIPVYGRLPLMVTENCPVKMYSKCGTKMKLIDRQKESFPFRCAPGCYSELLNSKPLYMADKFNDLKRLPVEIYKLDFTDESRNECDRILSYYMDGSNHKPQENTFTRGHYYRGVE